MATTTIVRATQSVSVVDPTVVDDDGNPTGARSVIIEDRAYDSDDPLVKEYPWAFVADVERATAAPGEKRNVNRKK